MNKFTEQQTMQITLALNDDVLNIARQKAQREHISLGAALSELMRLAIRSMQMPAAQRPAMGSKYAELPNMRQNHYQGAYLQTHGTRR